MSHISSKAKLCANQVLCKLFAEIKYRVIDIVAQRKQLKNRQLWVVFSIARYISRDIQVIHFSNKLIKPRSYLLERLVYVLLDFHGGSKNFIFMIFFFSVLTNSGQNLPCVKVTGTN